jgi:hypothetical protein
MPPRRGGDIGQRPSDGSQHVQAHVAAGFDPFVGLLGQHRADQPDDRGPVGEDAHHVGATADLLVQPLLGVVGPNLRPDLAGEGGEGKAWMAVLNPVIALFQDLPMKDRRALVELINQCAHEETDPERHLGRRQAARNLSPPAQPDRIVTHDR